MSASVIDPFPDSRSAETEPAAARGRRRRSSYVTSVIAHGEPVIWLTAGALILSVFMVLSLLALVLTLGLGTFTPRALIKVKLRDGRTLLGEVSTTEHFRLNADAVTYEPEGIQRHILTDLASRVPNLDRLPAMIDERRTILDKEALALGRRIADTRAKLEAIRANSRRVTTAFERGEWIRLDPEATRIQELRTLLVALEQRREALAAEIDAAGVAADSFQTSERLSVEAILKAEPPLRFAGINALISLVADQVDEDAVKVRRRRLRTGNYELTNEHFNWVADYHIAADGESIPPDATLVERTSWGRFYGTPTGFSVSYDRQVTDDEQQLESILDFAGQQLHRLSPEQQELTNRLLPAIEREHAALRSRAVEIFLQDVRNTAYDGQILRVVTKAGEQKVANQLEPEDHVVGALLISPGADSAWSAFSKHHSRVRKLESMSENREEQDLGALFASQERARLQVRQAQLDADLEVLPLGRQWLEAQQVKETLEQQKALGSSIVDICSQRFGESDPITQVIRAMHQSLLTDLTEQIHAQEIVQQKVNTALEIVPPELQESIHDYLEVHESVRDSASQVQAEIEQYRRESHRYKLELMTADEQRAELAVGAIVRAFQPNKMTSASAWHVYFSRWWEFLSEDPREANSEGGVLPAIWGTVVMALIMSIAVVPFGVIAALYLREYAKSGPIVSVIRIAINNLAGVPSIVFGVFGLGFFCYAIGGFLDGGPRNARIQPLTPASWYVMLGVLAMSSVAAFYFSILDFNRSAVTQGYARRWPRVILLCTWLGSFMLFVLLIFKTPFFHGFYEANLPDPTWGKGGVIWAALTLALMTLPVVIVATEEALSAVPNSMREGSYGCGASKWQTIRRIVLPHAMPGIMTGMILAMARGAGEVAPLMLVGAVKLAPELPLDMHFPFLHGNRSFMHLGFHIFDVGFQSQNSEAAKPMVYTTTLLLIAIITALNLLAIWLRSYLKRRFATGHF